MNEASWTVAADAQGVKVTDPSGEFELSLPWELIRGLVIQTNDSGPMGADVWWFAAGDEGSVTFPMGASGEKEALAFFQTLPGFDNRALIEAMQCTDNKTFLLWQKSK